MLDCDGNIDTSRLEKELRSALDADIKYKQTDNMKKKACKVAGSYDEFKAMVQCAHLKTLNRTEIESLKNPKKGWQSKRGPSTGQAHILASEMQQDAPVVSLKCKTEYQKPKNPFDLERDWARLPDDIIQKIRYLKVATSKRVVTLIEKTSNAEILEQVLTVLSAWCGDERFPAEKSASVDQPDATELNVDAADAAPLVEDEVVIIGTRETFKWFKRVAAAQGFNLMIRFFSVELRTSIAGWIERCEFEGSQDMKLKYLS